MTEIPMPDDGYPAPERQYQPPPSKGCCTRICECWLYLLCGGILLLVVLMILFGFFPLLWLFG
ncbi:MAG: hypothetical protein E3J86_05940 [Candidatus Thorarchaeota archaeon]|nr:MAG: hypothetical protein E3J86_05940 [Candidatus Thorarchaeota archaeon]